MSGRGRGRGRGRGGGPQSISQQFVLRSAEEAGLDIRNLRGLGARSGGIFPEIELHSSGNQERLHDAKRADGQVKQEDGEEGGSSAPPFVEIKRSPQTTYLISKGREIHHRMQNSVFYVRQSKEVPDVVRHSDRLRPPPNIDAGAVLAHCLGGRKRTRAGTFVPEELASGQRRVKVHTAKSIAAAAAAGLALNWKDLAVKIKRNAAGGEEAKDDGEEGDIIAIEEDEEESDGADYVTNHYESEGDESKGSDGEPTF